MPPSLDEKITGTLDALPGCNSVTSGPEYARPQTNCDAAPAVIGKLAAYFTDVTSENWAYQGCATDDYFERTLTGASTASDSMTVKTCAAFCESKGFALAGLEYARECYCGNEYSAADRAPKTGVMGACAVPCSGAADEICGAAGALSMYKKCEGGQCENASYRSSSSSSSSAGGEKRRRHLGQHKHSKRS